VLRQLPLEHLGERVLRGILVGTGRTALEMGADLPVQLRTELAALVLVQLEPDVLAVHAYLA